VSSGNITIVDQVDQRFGLRTSSAEVGVLGESAGSVTATVFSTTNNRVEVHIAINAPVTQAIVTIFYEVDILASGVDINTCQVVIPNRAILSTGAVTIQSSDYSGGAAINQPTRICITAAPDFTHTVTNSAANEELEAGDHFTLTHLYRNVGKIAAGDIQVVCTLDAELSFVSEAGWTNPSTDVFVHDLGALPIEGSARSLTVEYEVAEDAEEGTYSVTCCIHNVGSTLPTYCLDEACATASVEVVKQGAPNVKIIKRGKLIRQIHYDVDYFNPCADAATNVLVSEIIPAGTTFNGDLSDARWECVDGHCTLDAGTVPSNGSGCADFVVDIDEDTLPCTVFENRATVIASNDGDLSNNEDSVVIIEPGCPARNCLEECLEE